LHIGQTKYRIMRNVGIICDINYERHHLFRSYFNAVKNIYGKVSIVKEVSDLENIDILFIGDDLADALIFLMNNYNGTSHINVGTGVDIPIREVIIMIANIVGYEGSVTWNTSYPDGVYERRLDVTEINGLGWKAKVNLSEGLARTYDWFLKNYNYIRK